MTQAILTALIGGGILDLFVQGIRWIVARRRATRPEVVEQQRVHAAVAEAEASLTIVARSRDELEDDNRRLREQNEADRARYDADREQWRAERAEMRGELDKMEGRLRSALDEVQELKVRFRRDGED